VPITLQKNLKSFPILPVLFRATVHAISISIVIPTIIVAGTSISTRAVEELNIGKDFVLISGTGSMYPTFPKGEGKTVDEQSKEIVSTPGMIRYPRGTSIGSFDLLTYDIKRGDIVSFKNDITDSLTQELTGRPASFVKRVIGLAGDTIELRSGILYLNGEPQKEPYIARSRSTFGGEFLPECTQITVPENHFFVLGDNRKGSNDSRNVIGFVNQNDVHHVIPFVEQIGILDGNWRNTDKDLEESSVITLSVENYVQLLNNERQRNGLKPLTIQPKLNLSAQLRGKRILESNDFSTDATKSGYPMRRAVAEAGYSNITYGESIVQGYYEADELLDQQLVFPDSKAFLLTAEYQHIGVAAVEGKINGCPTQVIVRHFAGYVPPDYDVAVIESWEKSLARLREIQPSWEDAVTFGTTYEENKQTFDRIRAIINERISMQNKIVTTMRSNQWLSSELEEYMRDGDTKLAKEQLQLSTTVQGSVQ